MSEGILRNSSFESADSVLRKGILRIHTSVDEGDNIFRALTPGEIELAKSIFKDIVNYNRVKIYRGDHQSEKQPKVITQPRSGGVILTINEYRDDFSLGYENHHDLVSSTRLFILAMSFVWQYYRYDSSFCDAYASVDRFQYNLDKPSFNFYSMEQQASIIADYWVLSKYGLQEYEGLNDCLSCNGMRFGMNMEMLTEYRNVVPMMIGI